MTPFDPFEQKTRGFLPVFSQSCPSAILVLFGIPSGFYFKKGAFQEQTPNKTGTKGTGDILYAFCRIQNNL